MYIFGVALEELVYKDVERESFTVSEKHIVAFQIRLIVHPVHDDTIPAPALKEFFKHTVIIQELGFSVKKNPAVSRVFE